MYRRFFVSDAAKKALRLQKEKEAKKRIEDEESQRLLDQYRNSSLTGVEVGTLYERYIGYLYEIKGHDVEYHGAMNGYGDLGRDLIVKTENEIHIVQTKRWASYKEIPERHIFQLYGSMMHFKLSSNVGSIPVKAVFYTSANFSDLAKEVAGVLGVELKVVKFDKSYPMIKCNISANGEKIYHLPFDPYYDKIKIKREEGNFFSHTVKEAAAKGFRRAQYYKYAA